MSMPMRTGSQLGPSQRLPESRGLPSRSGSHHHISSRGFRMFVLMTRIDGSETGRRCCQIGWYSRQAAHHARMDAFGARLDRRISENFVRPAACVDADGDGYWSSTWKDRLSLVLSPWLPTVQCVVVDMPMAYRSSIAVGAPPCSPRASSLCSCSIMNRLSAWTRRVRLRSRCASYSSVPSRRPSAPASRICRSERSMLDAWQGMPAVDTWSMWKRKPSSQVMQNSCSQQLLSTAERSLGVK